MQNTLESFSKSKGLNSLRHNFNIKICFESKTGRFTTRILGLQDKIIIMILKVIFLLHDMFVIMSIESVAKSGYNTGNVAFPFNFVISMDGHILT